MPIDSPKHWFFLLTPELAPFLRHSPLPMQGATLSIPFGPWICPRQIYPFPSVTRVVQANSLPQLRATMTMKQYYAWQQIRNIADDVRDLYRSDGFPHSLQTSQELHP